MEDNFAEHNMMSEGDGLKLKNNKIKIPNKNARNKSFQ